MKIPLKNLLRQTIVKAAVWQTVRSHAVSLDIYASVAKNVFLIFIGCCLSLYPVTWAVTVSECEHWLCIYHSDTKGQKHLKDSADAIRSTMSSKPESIGPTAESKTCAHSSSNAVISTMSSKSKSSSETHIPQGFRRWWLQGKPNSEVPSLHHPSPSLCVFTH